jgi:hypothetical protein
LCVEWGVWVGCMGCCVSSGVCGLVYGVLCVEWGVWVGCMGCCVSSGGCGLVYGVLCVEWGVWVGVWGVVCRVGCVGWCPNLHYYSPSSASTRRGQDRRAAERDHFEGRPGTPTGIAATSTPLLHPLLLLPLLLLHPLLLPPSSYLGGLALPPSNVYPNLFILTTPFFFLHHKWLFWMAVSGGFFRCGFWMVVCRH